MKRIGVLGAALISFGAGLYLGIDREDSYEGVRAYLVRHPESSDRLIYDSIRVSQKNEISLSERTLEVMSEVLSDKPVSNSNIFKEVEGEAERFLQSLKKTEAYKTFHEFEERMEDLVR